MTSCIRILVAAGLAAASQLSHAVGVINMEDNGIDVVATASGSFNTMALSAFTASTNSFVRATPTRSGLNVGGSVLPDPAIDLSVFLGISGPSSIGTGATALVFADEATGDAFGVIPNRQLQLPLNYESGTNLYATSTWLGQSLTTLGVTPGTYVWTWGSDATADSLTLNISAVPEPESYAMLLAGLGALGWMGRQRRSAPV